MPEKDAKRTDLAALRRRAKKLLRGTPSDLASVPPEEAGRLLNELRVYQIELEMQNDELSKAQQELEASRVKYFDLYDLAPVGYFTVGGDGSILEANLRAGQLLGAERNRMVGQRLTRYVAPEGQDLYYLNRKRLLETGARQECELRMCREDGSPFWGRLEMIVAPGRENDPPVSRIVVSDITGTKRAEEVLMAEAAFRAGVIDCAAEGICVCHDIPDHPFVAFTVWNNRMTEITGYGMDEINRLGWYQSLYPDPEVQARARDRMDRMWRGDNLKREEWEITGSDGGRRGVAISTSVLQEGGGTVHVLGLFNDVTDRKRAEEENLFLERQVQQKQKLESLGVLAGGIAHDFNNLLMVVLGHAELASREIPPASPARGNLAGITAAAQRATALSRQMLAYAGRSAFAVERVGLGDLLEEMAPLLQGAISGNAILTLNLERDLPPIEADPEQIRQIAMNLVINASEAIGDRSGTITVSAGATRCDEEYLRKTERHDDVAPGPYVYLEVTDTGPGMDAETRARIFEPFFSTKFIGRGLGLAAVQGIVRGHKGALKVVSEPGQGTTFKVLFPALTEGESSTRSSKFSPRVQGRRVGAGRRGVDRPASTERKDATRPPPSSPPADWRGKGTILLVDDEGSLIDLGSQMLEHLGFSVLTAVDGLQAVDLYRERGKEIDLVLLDLTMPNMDGARAFDELRRLDPDVRIVLASGYSLEDVAARFEGKGIDGVLQKPYTLAKLRESLAGLLPKRMAVEG